jgi:hypothetical protein
MSKAFQQSVKGNPSITSVWVSDNKEFYTFKMPGCTQVSRKQLLDADFEEEETKVTNYELVNEMLADKVASVEAYEKIAGEKIELEKNLTEEREKYLALVVETDKQIAELTTANEEFAKINEQLAAENAELKTKKK